MSAGVPPEEYEGDIPEEFGQPVILGQANVVGVEVQYDATVQTNLLLEEISGKLDELILAIRGGSPLAPPAQNVPSVSTQDWQVGMQAAVMPQQGQPISGVQVPQTGDPSPGWVCPLHGQRKVVPAGISRRTNKPYSAFAACPIQGCNEKPPRGT